MNRTTDKVIVENVNVPGLLSRVDGRKYRAMRTAFLQILPSQPPGLTQIEVQQRVLPLLPAELFPGGRTSGWWAKTVQLDLEAKGVVRRVPSRPLRWHKA